MICWMDMWEDWSWDLDPGHLYRRAQRHLPSGVGEPPPGIEPDSSPLRGPAGCIRARSLDEKYTTTTGRGDDVDAHDTHHPWDGMGWDGMRTAVAHKHGRNLMLRDCLRPAPVVVAPCAPGTRTCKAPSNRIESTMEWRARWPLAHGRRGCPGHAMPCHAAHPGQPSQPTHREVGPSGEACTRPRRDSSVLIGRVRGQRPGLLRAGHTHAALPARTLALALAPASPRQGSPSPPRRFKTTGLADVDARRNACASCL
ncbi:hypothetical protein PCL_02466 [Purpureocillium lilacinum]|uniref:Uncharacterized protein n=1 Tax=Purpureocillium lilacinum TaxID=33203 RepID=A0A2U3E0N1_PURLI|nr:hypothetical protein PCL_02466 [Purpureocillium lilacinum]